MRPSLGYCIESFNGLIATFNYRNNWQQDGEGSFYY